jgi:hypothetical protein
MRTFSSTLKVSLMLALLVATFFTTSDAQVHGLGRARHALDARNKAHRPIAAVTAITVPRAELSILPVMPHVSAHCSGTTCIASSPTSTGTACDSALANCTDVNGANDFKVICDIDFHGQDIYPFILAGSYKQCLADCIAYNDDHNDTTCVGFVYAPDRVHGADDCYLKSSLNEPTAASIHLIGATRTTPTATQSPSSASSSSVSIPPSAPTGSSHKAASAPKLASITVKGVKELGSSTNNPTKQYVSHAAAQPIKLANDMTVPGVNLDLLQDFSIAADTGVWSSDDFLFDPNLEDMKSIPHLSRDGGKGGMVNGTNVFLFCDTGVYSDGDFVAFVSSSVATDESMNGLEDKPLELVDHVGEWQDDVGRMRGFAPMTEGEEAYNKAVSGKGFRYAVWPESSPICLNASTSLIYASLVYDEVNMNNIEEYNLTYFGNTLLETRVDGDFGPWANRLVPQLFKENEIPFGSLGGFRAWGKSGYGNMDGEILLFGKAPNHTNSGIFAAKTYPQNFTSLDSYSYWNGHEWSSEKPDPTDLLAAFLDLPVVDLDIIYMPKAKTFMMIYTSFPPDNTFYYRQLYPNTDHTVGVYPPYEKYGDELWAETIITGKWEDNDHVLYKVPNPAMGTMYAAGVHAGYYGSDDIVNGGNSILVSWTEHTGKEGESPESGYAHKTAKATITYN